MKENEETCLPGCQNGCPQLNVKLSSINPGLTSLKWSHLFVFNVCLLPWTKSLISFSPFWVKSLFTYFKRSHFPNVSSFASFGPYFAHLLPQSVLFGHFPVACASWGYFKFQFARAWSTSEGWTARWTPAARLQPWSKRCAGWRVCNLKKCEYF